MLRRQEPLNSGRDTDIDMIEREMEGGVLVIQSPSIYEQDIEKRLGGLIEIERNVRVRKVSSKG